MFVSGVAMLKLSKFKHVLMIMLLATVAFMPCKDLVVQASSFIQSVTISAEEGGSVESGSTGSSGESGSTGSNEESGGTATEEEQDTEIIFSGFPINTNTITDDYLYDALLELYKSVNTSYKGSTLYSDMFNNEHFTEINLDNKNISSLEGMQKLDLGFLESFSVALNDLTEFDAKVLKNVNVDKFKTLSLASNGLKTLIISENSKLTGLENLDVSNNSITALNLNSIEAKLPDTEFTLNVAGNPIKNMSDIVLPNKRIGHVNINIINTNIYEISDEYFTDKYTLKIGVQGFKSDDEKFYVDTLNNVKIYKINQPNLRVDVYKIDGDRDVLVASVKDSDIAENYKKLELGVGQYEYYYMLDNENVEAYDKYDSQRAYLDSGRFYVIPQTVSYVYVYKGEEYEELRKVTGEVTVKLFSAEDATIMYQVNGGEWVEGNIVECNHGGTYSIKAKVIIDGVESEVQNIWVRTSLNLYVPDALMLALILLLVLALFLVVLPIISRKYFKRD